ncbi:MAG: hypothetical protein ACI9CF_001897 [Candidatus Omnitrophota bacterium]|jgi:hypothetical protein
MTDFVRKNIFRSVVLGMALLIFGLPNAQATITSNSASISIRIVADPVFSLANVIGKVFNDINANGMQDMGEEGIPNITLVTEEGAIIVTDQFGRYHIPQVIAGRHIVKIDTHSLPANSELISAESAYVRASAGLLNQVNFGVKLPETYQIQNYDINDRPIRLNMMQKYEATKPRIAIRFLSPAELAPQPLFDSGELEKSTPLFSRDQMVIDLNYAAFIKNWTLMVTDESGAIILNDQGQAAPPQVIDTRLWSLSEGEYDLELVLYDNDDQHDIIRRSLEVKELDPLSASAGSDSSIEKSLHWKKSVQKDERDIHVKGDVIAFNGEAKPYAQIWIQGHKIIADAKGSFNHETILPSGDNTIPIEVMSPRGEFVEFTEEIKVNPDYYFIAGLAEYEVGRLVVGGNLDSLSSIERYYQSSSLYDDEWVAFYLKAKWNERYHLTVSYDNERDKDELFRDLEVDDIYPTFGDMSSLSYDATDTQDELYLKFEFDQSYMLWGDYGTGFTGTETAHFNRTLNGGKVHLQSLGQTEHGDASSQLTAYTATARQLATHVEFRGTGGTLYSLKNKDIVQGSEKVLLETRDEITGLPISRLVQVSGYDYEIDYDQGRILFHKPISSVNGNSSITSESILDGNPQYVIVDYEYASAQAINRDNLGVRATQRILNDHVRIGGTVVRESHTYEDYQLNGADVLVNLPWNTEILSEYTTSKTESVRHFGSRDGGLTFEDNLTLADPAETGSAFKIHAQTELPTATKLQAYYRDIDENFSNTTISPQVGTEKFGVSVLQPVTDNYEFSISLDKSITSTSSEVAQSQTDARSVTTLLTQHEVEYGALTLTGEYRYTKKDDQEGFDPQASDLRDDFGVEANFDLTEKTQVFVGGQMTGRGEGNNLAKAGMRFALDDGSKVKVTQTHGEQGDSTIMSTSREIAPGITKYTESVRTRQADSGQADMSISSGLRGEIGSMVSLYNEEEFDVYQGVVKQSRISGVGMRLTEHLTVKGSYEKINQDNDSVNIADDALHVGFIYADLGKIKVSSNMDLRFRDRVTEITQIVSDNAIEYHFNDDWTFFDRLEFAHSEDQDSGSHAERYNEIQIGIAYRPVKNDRINFILQYKRLDDQAPLEQEDNASIQRYIDELYELDVAMQLSPKLTLIESYANRARQSISSASRSDSNLYQWVNRLEYELNPQWDLIGEYRVEGLHQSDELEQGGSLEVDYKPLPFVRLTAGYSFKNFENNVSEADDVETEGVFFRFSGDMSAFKQEDVMPVLKWATDKIEDFTGWFKMPHLNISIPTLPPSTSSPDYDISQGNLGVVSDAYEKMLVEKPVVIRYAKEPTSTIDQTSLSYRASTVDEDLSSGNRGYLIS